MFDKLMFKITEKALTRRLTTLTKQQSKYTKQYLKAIEDCNEKKKIENKLRLDVLTEQINNVIYLLSTIPK